MLQVEQLRAGPLRPLGFTLEAGECLAVTGPSGCGKTSLLRALADLDPPAVDCVGTVTLQGLARAQVPGPEWRRRVRYFAAESGWWEDRVGAHFADWNAQQEFRERLQIPADACDWPVARLSSGERQRLALLRGLEQIPEVLLLDEPTRSLDAETRDVVEQIVQELLTNRCAIWVSHDPEQTQRVATRVLDLSEFVGAGAE